MHINTNICMHMYAHKSMCACIHMNTYILKKFKSPGVIMFFTITMTNKNHTNSHKKPSKWLVKVVKVTDSPNNVDYCNILQLPLVS